MPESDYSRFIEQAIPNIETCMAIPVNKITDRILVRRQVREAARGMNFGLIEQATISLAAYNVISKMGMGMTCNGEVFVNHVQDGIRDGVQIVCTTTNNKIVNITLNSFSDTYWLVDELKVEKITPNGARVIFVIWSKLGAIL